MSTLSTDRVALPDMTSEERKAYQRNWVARKRREKREAQAETITLDLPLSLARKLRANKPQAWTFKRFLLRTLSASVGGAPIDRAAPRSGPLNVPAKVGRNDLCPCGSGRKFKRCCGAG